VKSLIFEEKNRSSYCVFSLENVTKKGELYASLQGSDLESQLPACALKACNKCDTSGHKFLHKKSTSSKFNQGSTVWRGCACTKD
jgi:hypothetical protein